MQSPRLLTLQKTTRGSRINSIHSRPSTRIPHNKIAGVKNQLGSQQEQTNPKISARGHFMKILFYEF